MGAVTPIANSARWIDTSRGYVARFTDPADGDTFQTPFTQIDAVIVSFTDAAAVAADSIAVTWSGGVITFESAGTARDVQLLIFGA